MKFCKRIWLRYHISKYERILMEEGIMEAARRGKNIQFGLEGRAVMNDNIVDTIYLPQNERGQTDISPILALGPKNKKDEARRYIVYQKMLARLERKS